MSALVSVILVCVTAALVFACGWRMLPRQSSAAGGSCAVLLFLLHPAIVSGVQNSSPWDALFVMLFVSSWLWMENWSLFMRSWVLAGIFSFGLWVGSPFVFWGFIAMVPWVLFNRRPLPAVGSLVTVVAGGFILFVLTWGAAWFFLPNLGPPMFMPWIRWGGLKMPPAASLSWFLLAAGAVIERFRDMLKNRRSDASIFAAVLLVVTALFGSSSSALTLIALAAPLIARLLVKKEFLFHRRVRRAAGLTLLLALVLSYVFKTTGWMVSGAAMIGVGLGSWWEGRSSRFPRFMLAEAVCVGAYAAGFLETLFHFLAP